jgi:aminoglycoside phosphotransferase (APT) family kinase protein
MDNMIIHATEPRVAAVLDWELCTIGDPLADFTYLLMNWINGSLSTVTDLEARGIPTVDEAVAQYCSLTGRAGLHDLDWFCSYNTFRLAGILQGIVGRVRDGTANSPHAAQQADRVLALAQTSWKFAQRAGAR